MGTRPLMTKIRDDEQTSERRGRLLAKWFFGGFLAMARYLMHRVPLYRRNRRVLDEPEPPDIGRDLPGDPATLQRSSDGLGTLYHRRYAIAFTDAACDLEELIEKLRENPNAASPIEFSEFRRLDDHDGGFEAGDELVVRLPGPWDGPVRVVEVTPTSYRFVTMKGHMEAGEIEFRARRNERGWIVFEIESWARSGDRLFSFLYERLPLARELQLHMWAHFCQRVVKIAGGILMANIELHTCTVESSAPSEQAA